MRYIAPFIFALVFALALPASGEQTPRVDAKGTEVRINEVNTGDYPKVRVIATVLKDGVPVTGLTENDFRVREDEVDQEPLTVEPKLPPLSVVLTVDSSGSMSKRMEQTKAAAAQFATELADTDSVQLVSFAREVKTVTPMTTTRQQVTEGIESLTARGDTALYDALAQSIDLVSSRDGRKAIVLLSDGVDDDGTGKALSTATVQDVLGRAAEVNVPIFVIGLGTQMDEGVLTNIASSTGAVYLNAPEPEQLSDIYKTIGRQLSGQYSINYTSSLPADGTSRRVDLAALDQQASKSYTAKGSKPVETAAVPSSDGCTLATHIEAERDVLSKAAERHKDKLIGTTERNDVRKASLKRLLPKLEEPGNSLDCLIDAVKVARDLYRQKALSITDRNKIRDTLAQPIADLCKTRDTLEGVRSCYDEFAKAYRGKLIDITTRNRLREEARANLLDQLKGMSDTDAALTQVRDMYQAKLISITERNDLRKDVLAGQ